jgi:hypothetical protein
LKKRPVLKGKMKTSPVLSYGHLTTQERLPQLPERRKAKAFEKREEKYRYG